MTLKILLNGSKGRMGAAIQQAAANTDGCEIVAAIDQGADATTLIGDCDVVIDFSFHAATAPLATLCAEHRKPLVIGTTGHTDDEKEAIRAAGQAIPIVWAGNYSVGVNLLNFLVRKAAEILPEAYHPEVVEMHHRHKVDAPSGTAEQLIAIIREARSLTREQERHGRQGVIGAREDAEIGVHALRGGDIVGEHTAMFAGPGERIELTHRAYDRQIFAQGAIRAARWLANQQATGIYGMDDVLGLEG